MKKNLFALSTIVLLFGSVLTIAQNRTSLSFQVSYAFEFDSKIHPAGKYRFVFDGTNPRVLELFNEKTQQKEFIPYITRLSPHSKAGVVFDTIDGMRHLSEIYFTGTDGFQILATKKEHSHDTAPAGSKY